MAFLGLGEIPQEGLTFEGEHIQVKPDLGAPISALFGALGELFREHPGRGFPRMGQMVSLFPEVPLVWVRKFGIAWSL